MIHISGALNTNLWVKVMNITNYFINQLPKKANSKIIPFGIF
jgi:hypothetical protein